MNLIFGVAGFAKEIDWLAHDLFRKNSCDYRPDYFIAEDGNRLVGTEINGCPVLSEDDAFHRFRDEDVNCFIGVGNPEVRGKIAAVIRRRLGKCRFPVLVHPDAVFDDRPGKVDIGEGTVICAKSVLTTDIKIGSFVHVNLDCTIGHDTVLADFITVSPGVHISGNVRIAERVFIGTGSVIVERIEVCADTVLCASSTVSKPIVMPGTYAGSPARKVK